MTHIEHYSEKHYTKMKIVPFTYRTGCALAIFKNSCKNHGCKIKYLLKYSNELG